MVNKSDVTSLTSSGLRDWLIQRISAAILAVYLVFLFGFFVTHPRLDYFVWRALFKHRGMQIGSVLFLISLFWHTWVGMWTIVTDYIKSSILRLVVQVAIILALLLYLVWGLAILWDR